MQFLIENEKQVHVEDLLLRRSTLAWLGDLSRVLIEEMATIFAARLNWSKADQTREVERTIAHLKEFHGIDIK